MPRGVRGVSNEGGSILGHPPQDCENDVLHYLGRRESVEAPVVHRRQAQRVFALQQEFPVRLQLESQVGEGVRRRYPVPWVLQVGAEAQMQARDSLRGVHGALWGVELDAHHPEVRGNCLHALDKVLQHVGHHQQVVYIGLDEAPLCVSRRC